MLDFFDLSYSALSPVKAVELFNLRKKTFKDRLDWQVNNINELEYDEYDSTNTEYLVGEYDNKLLCGVRFIDLKYNNMIFGTFKPYFDDFEIPDGCYVEASRLFIDKERVREEKVCHKPISALLFLSMINYALFMGYEGIYAIVSHPMYIIFKRSGWRIQEVKRGASEKNETIYLIFMPVDDDNQHQLVKRVESQPDFVAEDLKQWPFSVFIRDNGSD